MRKNEQEPEYCGVCPKCGGEMYKYREISMKLGEESFFFSDLNRLMSGSLTVVPARCRLCCYTELYTPYENELTDC